MLETSSAIDRTKLDPNFVYIQITSVAPYLDAEEKEARKTPFDRLHNLNKYVWGAFSTPRLMRPEPFAGVR